MNSLPQDFWLDQLGSARLFNAWVYSQIQPYLEGQIAEIGCGRGTFTTLIAAQGYTVTGFDIHAPYVEVATQRLRKFPSCNAICADVTVLPWAHESFNTIVMLDLLEHIENDVGLLRKLRDGLGSDGRLILKVPAGKWLYSTMDKAIGHFRRYSRRSLANTLNQAGFSVMTMRAFNAAAIPGWWLNGRVLKRVTPPANQVVLFERVMPMIRTVENALRIPIGISLIAVGSPG